jgi:glycosyltransferase involved in cell wall biosynthesis
LGIRVTREGVVLPDRDGLVVCVAAPKKLRYSETFIRAHVEKLPGKVRPLLEGHVIAASGEERPLLPRFQDLINRVLGRLLRMDSSGIHRAVLRNYPERLRTMTLRAYLRRERVQAVLAEYGSTGVEVMRACKEGGIPLTVHFHGFDAYKHSALANPGHRYPELFENAAAVIAVSKDMERQLLKLGAPRTKLYYNPYGVDTRLFQGADPFHSLPVFAAVARFADKKAPYLTIHAFKKVVDKVPEARMIMLGEGPLWESCKGLARFLRVSNAVEFVGSRPPSEVTVVLQKARAFVQHSVTTSYGDSEGTPVSVLEAGSAGLPIVATRHGGIQDVVIDGETGLLVNEEDVEGMGEHMLRLARDPALAAKLGQAGRKRVCAEFSMEKSIANLYRIIEATVIKKNSL